MPIYEFVCKSCGKKFSLLVISTSSEKEDVKCPHCGSSDVKRVFSPFGSIGGVSRGSCTSFG